MGREAQERPSVYPNWRPGSRGFFPVTDSCGQSIGRPAIFCGMAKGQPGSAGRSEILQGTLDLMVLKTLHALGPLHGYGIARRIEQVSDQLLRLNEGTVYTSLLRLQQKGWIAASWGTSENNRRAKYYAMTASGLKQLARETESWKQISGIIGRLLRLSARGDR